MTHNYALILDDNRSIEESLKITGRNIPFGGFSEYFLVKSYKEFTDYITTYGVPEFISFDYDLFEITGTNPESGFVTAVEGKTGLDCAEWLLNHIKFSSDRPKWAVHSANKEGARQIRKLLTERLGSECLK